MINVLEYMGNDHDRLDGIFSQFHDVKYKDLARAKSLFHEFRAGLQRHIFWEEEILFPLFELYTDMYEYGPTAVMRQEHKQIKQHLEQIHARLSSGEMNIIDSLEQELLSVLKPHNDKEEGVLYPWIDKSVSEGEREKAFQQMKLLPPEKYMHCCSK